MTKTHGQSGTKLHYVWIEMRQRCSNPEHRRFSLYGARGIKVCNEWQLFEVFYKWAKSSGYQEGLSLDRIDNDGNYEPNNCRWATQIQQVNNTRVTKMVTYRGRTQSLSDWSRELNLNYYTLRSRLRIGWSVQKIFETPMKGGRETNDHNIRTS